MNKNNKIPEWVYNLEDGDTNKETLIQLSIAGSQPLSAPRSMTFVLRGLDKNNELIRTLQINGWDVSHGFENGFWVEALKESYVIDEKKLTIDEEFFKKIAHQFGWEYDGWYASVI